MPVILSMDDVWQRLWVEPGNPDAPVDRPLVAGAMVSSLDGHATEGGRVADLTGPADQDFLHRLRAAHDAVLVGATTVRVEGYDSLLRPREREARIREGMPAQPALCIVSGRGALDSDIPAFQVPDMRTLVLTGSDAKADGLPSHTDVLRAPANDAGELDMAALIRQLGSLGFERVLCEGGPTLIGSLARGGLIDDFFFTAAPRFSGGDGPRPIANVGAQPRTLSLRAVAAHDDYLFTRYRPAR